MMGSKCSKPYKSMDRKSVVLCSTTLGGGNSHPSMVRAYHQYQYVPNSGTTIPGHAGKHQYSACRLPSRQGERDNGRSHQNLQHGFPLSSLALPLPGEAQHSNPGYFSSPFILPLPAETLNNSNQDYEVPLSYHNPPKKTLLVERTPFQMEWETSKGQVRSSYHQLRCLPTRLEAACENNCTSSAW